MLTRTRLSGNILHSEIIGRNTRDLVRSSGGANLRVYLPTLTEYVTLTPRMVTPVSLLHFPPDSPGLRLSPVDLPRGRQSHSLLA